MRFDEKRAVVTGATSGIGAAIATRLAQDGADLILTGRDLAKGEAIAKTLRKHGGRVDFILNDLRQESAADQLALAALEGGPVDILVNNAGVLFRGTAIECTDDQWDATFSVNVTAVFRVSRAFLRGMVARKSGVIVNIASDWGLVGAQGAVAYGASKGAVVQMTKSMALDHARDGVRVNAVCPGDTDTSMLNSAMTTTCRRAELARMGQAIPIGRVADPKEIAAAVSYLASDDASFITGAALAVDGGNSAQ